MRKILTVREIADHLHISKKRVYRLVMRGIFPRHLSSRERPLLINYEKIDPFHIALIKSNALKDL